MKIKRKKMRAEIKNPIEALIGQEETFPESRTKDQRIKNSNEKIREQEEIVPQIQHPNNVF